jgi:large subunit ribosomal protein L19
MPSRILHEQAERYVKSVPEIEPGYTVRVHEKIQEGGKERTQICQGLVIAIHKGSTPADSTFTVRRVVSGVGVENIYPFHSPAIEKIEVKKIAKVRRAKLYFLRGRQGKAARMNERFTKDGDFAAAVAPKKEAPSPEAVAPKIEVVEQAGEKTE